MPLFSSTLTSLEEEIKSLSDDINSIVNEANKTSRPSSTLLDEYNNKRASYDSKIGAYEDALEQFQKTNIAYNAFQSTKTIPSVRDRLQHYPGGSFGHYGALAGGVLFSPVFMPEMEVGKQNANSYSNLLNGNIMTFLNSGLGELYSLINMGILDVDFSKSSGISVTIPIKIDIEVSGKFGKRIETFTIYVNEGDSKIDMSETTIGANMDLDELDAAINYEPSAFESTISNTVGSFAGNPLAGTVSIAMYNLATGDTVRAAQTIVNSTVSSIIGAISQRVTQMAVTTFNITSMPTVFGLMMSLSALTKEVFEMAVGLDISFGLGGDYAGKDENEKNVYDASIGLMQAVNDTIAEVSAAVQGRTVNTATYNPDLINSPLTDSNGIDVGFQSTSGNFTDVTNTRDVTVTSIEGILGDVTSGTFGAKGGFVENPNINTPIGLSSLSNLDDISNLTQSLDFSFDSSSFSDYAEEATGGDGNNENSGYSGPSMSEGGYADSEGGWGGV